MPVVVPIEVVRQAKQAFGWADSLEDVARRYLELQHAIDYGDEDVVDDDPRFDELSRLGEVFDVKAGGQWGTFDREDVAALVLRLRVS